MLKVKNWRTSKPVKKVTPQENINRKKEMEEAIEKKLAMVSIEPSSQAFRTTLKPRHMDDNPKVLATIIRKKS